MKWCPHHHHFLRLLLILLPQQLVIVPVLRMPARSKNIATRNHRQRLVVEVVEVLLLLQEAGKEGGRWVEGVVEVLPLRQRCGPLT
jgi:hypothetical protein